MQLLRGATQVWYGRIGNSVNAYIVIYGVHHMNVLDSPATTSPITYKMQHRIGASSGEYGGEIFAPSGSVATRTLMEIAG